VGLFCSFRGERLRGVTRGNGGRGVGSAVGSSCAGGRKCCAVLRRAAREEGQGPGAKWPRRRKRGRKMGG
jgi:hypothetical protein